MFMISFCSTDKTTEFSEAGPWAWWVTVKTEIRKVSEGYEVMHGKRACGRIALAVRFRIPLSRKQLAEVRRN